MRFGSGFRGGNWNNATSNARVSDRNNAANTNSNRNNNNGFRAAKTVRDHRDDCFSYSPVFLQEMNSLFEKIVSRENLYAALKAAAAGKRHCIPVARFLYQAEEQIDRLHCELVSGDYCHGSYTCLKVFEPKERDISVSAFRDRVVHHAFHDVIEPVIDKKFIFDSYACRNGKGTHVALDRAQKFLRANKYCFHGDVRKYFPSIDHGVLKGLLRRHIADVRVLSVLDNIIDSANSVNPVRGRGLPIGNLTSQFFANLFLHELDHYVKHDLGCRYYIRYMDDFLVFDDDHRRVEEARCLMRRFLASCLNLEMHESKSQIFSTRGGVKFLGFRLYASKRRLASENVRRFRSRLKRFGYLFERGLMDGAKIKASIDCWVAHSSYADAVRLRAKFSRSFPPGAMNGARNTGLDKSSPYGRWVLFL